MPPSRSNHHCPCSVFPLHESHHQNPSRHLFPPISGELRSEKEGQFLEAFDHLFPNPKSDHCLEFQ
uniref:Uncharacterized protein n=1 Tax=Lotus japonicus TaxID=34305 RepID=I3STL2_LOTJA|nr:unknown [Lotus japonicus]